MLSAPLALLRHLGLYLIRVLIALDAFVQACTNYGIIGITISTRAYTARVHGHRWGIILANVLDWIQPEHCWRSLEGDRRRARAVLASLEGYRRPSANDDRFEENREIINR